MTPRFELERATPERRPPWWATALWVAWWIWMVAHAAVDAVAVLRFLVGKLT